MNRLSTFSWGGLTNKVGECYGTSSGYIETTGEGQILSLITSLFMFGIELLKHKRGEA